MMNQTNDNNAFAEILFIIKCLPYNEQNKISKKFIEFLDENKNDDYEVDINPNIALENQKLLDETKELLKELYIAYFSSNEEKNKILKHDYYRNIVEEDLKNQNYNYNNIFKTSKSTTVVEDTRVHSLSILKHKESFFARFKDFIFKILHINK